MNRVTGRVGAELGEGVMLMNRVTGRVGVELGEGVMLMNRVTGRVGVELGEGVMLMNRVTGRVGVELGEGVMLMYRVTGWDQYCHIFYPHMLYRSFFFLSRAVYYLVLFLTLSDQLQFYLASVFPGDISLDAVHSVISLSASQSVR